MADRTQKKLLIPGAHADRYAEMVPWGAGAEAEIYRAERRSPPGTVALKVLVPQGTPSQQARRRERFEREAGVLLSITHPNVARAFVLFDVVLKGEPTEALELEWLPDHLGERIARHPDGLPAVELERYLQQSLEGLAALQAEQVAVRDIRPENLLLSERGVLKLADLGMARTPGGGGSMTNSSQYAAPEVASGAVRARLAGDSEPKPEAYFAADVYSLGVIFYEAAVGGTRWESLPELAGVTGDVGAGAEVDPNRRWKEWHADEGKRLPPVCGLRSEVPKRVAAVVDGMVEKERAKRIGTAAQALAMLGGSAAAAPAAPGQKPAAGRSRTEPAAPLVGSGHGGQRDRAQSLQWRRHVLPAAAIAAVAVAALTLPRLWSEPAVPKDRTAEVVAEPERGTLVIKAEVQCQVKVDGEVRGMAGPGAPVPVEVEAEREYLMYARAADGREWEQPGVRVAKGESLVVKVPLSPRDPARPSRRPAPSDEFLKDGTTALAVLGWIEQGHPVEKLRGKNVPKSGWRMVAVEQPTWGARQGGFFLGCAELESESETIVFLWLGSKPPPAIQDGDTLLVHGRIEDSDGVTLLLTRVRIERVWPRQDPE